MRLSDLIEDAKTRYRARILFSGVNTTASRTYYRLLTSLERATQHGIIDITLYLTRADFAELCEGMDIDPKDALEKDMQLTDDTPLLVPDDEPPFSMLVGFGADGRQTPFPVLSDEDFVKMLTQGAC